LLRYKMHWIYYGGRFFTRVVLFLFTRWRVLGRDNILAEGPLLVAANHLNLADPPIMGCSINRQAMFLAKEELFLHRIPRYIVGNYGAFPIRRGGMNRDALRFVEKLFGRGGVLIAFPEGRRSTEAQIAAAFSGSALIAVRNRVPWQSDPGTACGVHAPHYGPYCRAVARRIPGAIWWRKKPAG